MGHDIRDISRCSLEMKKNLIVNVMAGNDAIVSKKVNCIHDLIALLFITTITEQS